MKKLALAFFIMVIMPGCAVFASIPPAIGHINTGVSIFSYFSTGKGSGDHVMSAIKKEDCALHRIITEGDVCKPLAETVAKIEEKDPDRFVDLSLSTYQQQATLFIEF